MKTHLKRIIMKIKIVFLLKPQLIKRIGASSVISIFLVLGTWGVYANFDEDSGKEQAKKNGIESALGEFQFRATNPTKNSEESNPVLLGKVLSNETANVYPRRDGIAEDIFFDIGDRVKKGDVLATLLPPGVEGENTAMIYEKKAYVGKAASNLSQARKVAASSVEQERIRLQEKEIAYQKARDTQEVLVSKAKTIAETTDLEEKAKVEAMTQEIQVIEANIALLENQLLNSSNVEDEMIQKRLSDKSQALEQLNTAFIEVKQDVEHVLLGNNERGNYRYLNESDIEENIGIYDRNLRASLVTDFNNFTSEQIRFSDANEEGKKEMAFGLIQKGEQVLSQTQRVLSASTSELFSNNNTQVHGDLTNLVQQINTSQNTLLKAKEKYQDSQNDYLLSASSGVEKISRLENQIEYQKELLKLSKKKLKLGTRQKQKNVKTARRDLEKTEVMEGADVKLLQAQVDLAREKVELMQAQQNKMIASEVSNLQVASAQLQKEQAKSGNVEVRSPFSGVISKRTFSVGEMVAMSKPVFELIDVETSLSKKAKREIKFQIPENMSKEVEIGDEIDFEVLEESGETYKAIVSRKSPQVDSDSHTITVQAKLDDSLQIAHNRSVRVLLNKTEAEVFQLPVSVIKRSYDTNYIWILKDDNRPKKLRVNVIADDGEFAEVTGKIDINTQVILDSPDLFEKNLKSKKPETSN